jgi:DNA (cytosine-5)-methyltransferase 1
MRHGSLFSGIGGFDLASEWMGWENVFHCEWNLFGQKVLKYYWPKAISYNDITKTDFSIHRGKIDIITGGFPCQPYSTAGKRLGKEDERHLWPEMLRAIREIQPQWIVGENVRGIISWNKGLVFDEVQSEMEFEGYEVQSFILPAASVGAPHRRERVWFVGFKNNNVKNSSSIGQKWGMHKGKSKNANGKQFSKSNASNLQNTSWENFPTEYPLCNGNNGISERLDGITFLKWRNESIKAGGNAIVPQVVYQIFKAIEQYNNLNK